MDLFSKHQGLSRKQAKELEKVYDSLLNRLKNLPKKDSKFIRKSLEQLVDFLIVKLATKDQALLLYTGKNFQKDYVFAHTLNVGLIGLRLGMRWQLSDKKLRDLGILAFTHSKEDMGLPSDIAQGIIADQNIDQILRLADVYDALTHPPSYRQSMTSVDALGAIIANEDFCDRHLVKALLEELSMYPQASWVQLSSGEIGKVVLARKDNLLRPIVQLITDSKVKLIKIFKEIDLLKEKDKYIIRSLPEEEIRNLTSI